MKLKLSLATLAVVCFGLATTAQKAEKPALVKPSKHTFKLQPSPPPAPPLPGVPAIKEQVSKAPLPPLPVEEKALDELNVVPAPPPPPPPPPAKGKKPHQAIPAKN